MALCISPGVIFAAVLSSVYTFDNTADNAVSGAPNGTLLNAPGYVDGVVGTGALSLNGTNQRVDTSASAYPRMDGLKDASFSFWFRSTDTTSFGHILHAVSTGNQTALSIAANMNANGQLAAGNFRLFVRSASNGQLTFSLPAGDHSGNMNGSWQNLTISWAINAAASNNVATYYLNGVSLGSTRDLNSVNASHTFSAWTATSLGGTTANSLYFNGAMDDVAAWSGRLTDTEAKALYSMGVDTLSYGALDANGLFALYGSGSGTYLATDGKEWQMASGLSGTPGTVVNNAGYKALILDADGSGVETYFQVIPEPGTLALLGMAFTIIWGFQRRRSAFRT